MTPAVRLFLAQSGLSLVLYAASGALTALTWFIAGMPAL